MSSHFFNENIEFLKNHFFLIEDHSTLYYDKNIKEKNIIKLFKKTS